MSLTTIVTQFALTVGASLAERIASALSARIKQEPEKANPVDIAIATRSAVSADREGKIASAKAAIDRKFDDMQRELVASAFAAPTYGMVGRIHEMGKDPVSDYTWLEVVFASSSAAVHAGTALRASANDGTHVSHAMRTGTMYALHTPRSEGRAVIRVSGAENVLGLTCWDYLFVPHPSAIRRLGDYGPSGGGE